MMHGQKNIKNVEMLVVFLAKFVSNLQKESRIFSFYYLKEIIRWRDHLKKLQFFTSALQADYTIGVNTEYFWNILPLKFLQVSSVIGN
jgi:hypothetical protein